jgi:hypothetical protein
MKTETAISIYIEKYKDAIHHYIQRLALQEDLHALLINDIETEPNKFYFCYTSLFTTAENELITRINICGYFYFRYLILTDTLFDSKNSQGSVKQLILTNWYHEESIRLLSAIFQEVPEFWNYWQLRKTEYIHAFKTDKEFITQLDLHAFEQLADHKSANGKVSLDILYLLKFIDVSQYHLLLESHKYFSCGMQCYDDVFDIRQDFNNQQTNFALSELLKTGQQPGDSVHLEKLLHIKGIASKLLKKAEIYFHKALQQLSAVDCPLWKQTILSKMNEVLQVSKQVDFYIESLGIKSSLSNTRKYNSEQPSAGNIEAAISGGLQFIASRQERNGNWKDCPVNGWLSGYWTTGFVLHMLAETESSVDIKKGLQYLRSKTSKAWGYIEGWIDDADSTNFALLALSKYGIPMDAELAELMTYQLPDGGFTTYKDRRLLLRHLNDPRKENVNGWMQSHLCVSAGTLLLLSRINGYDDARKKLVRYFTDQHRSHALYPSYWWSSAIYTTSLFIEANCRNNFPELHGIVHEMKGMLINHINENGFCGDAFSSEHLFYTSLAMAACMDENTSRHDRELLKKSASALVHSQYDDGSWNANYALRIPASDCMDPSAVSTWRKTDLGENIITEDIHRIITTSAVVRALHKYLQLEN